MSLRGSNHGQIWTRRTSISNFTKIRGAARPQVASDETVGATSASEETP